VCDRYNEVVVLIKSVKIGTVLFVEGSKRRRQKEVKRGALI